MLQLHIMNGSVTVPLGDTLVGASTGRSEHHKSLNKTELAAAQSQAFSKLLLAAKAKGNETEAPEETEPELEAKTEDAKNEASIPEETDQAEADALPTSATLAMLNPDWKQVTSATDQPVLSQQGTTSKSVKDSVVGTTDAFKEKSTSTGADKSAVSTAVLTLSTGSQGKEMPEAMLMPILPALPVLPALPPVKGKSTVSTSEKGGVSAATVTAKGAVVGAVAEKGTSAGTVEERGIGVGAVVEKTAVKAGGEGAGTELASSEPQGPQTAWSSYQAAVTGEAKSEPALVAGTNEASVNKNGLDGRSGLSGVSGDMSNTASAVPDVVRDPSASSSTADAVANVSAQSSITTAASSASMSAVHAAEGNAPTAVTHEAPGAAVGTGQATGQDFGSLGARGDGVGRSAQTANELGATNAHTLLDSATSAGREGTWQISSNRVEAGFANGQDSWTSVVAQRQQGHVTATLEMGSAAEHSATVSMLPQLNQHLADRQLPVDHLGASLRQQPGSDREAGASNQGQTSDHSHSQSQRGQVVTPTISSVTSTVTTGDGGRNSVDGSRISVRA